MLSVVLGGFAIALIFCAFDELFSGSKTLKITVFSALFFGLIATLFLPVAVSKSKINVACLAFVLACTPPAFYNKSPLNKFFLVYIGVLSGIFLYFYGEYAQKPMFYGGLQNSLDGIVILAIGSVSSAKSKADCVFVSAISVFNYQAVYTAFGQFQTFPSENGVYSAALAAIVSVAILGVLEKFARVLAAKPTFMLQAVQNSRDLAQNDLQF